MKHFFHILIILIFSSMHLMGIPMKFNNGLPSPDHREIIDNEEFLSFKLSKLIHQQKWSEFYIAANSALDKIYEMSLKDISPDHFLDQLWALYYITGAPMFDMDIPEHANWIADHQHLDYQVKKRALFMIARPYSSMMNKKPPIKLKTLGNWCIPWYSSIIKHFREFYDPVFNQDILKRISMKEAHSTKIAKNFPNEDYMEKESVQSLRNDDIEGDMEIFEQFFINMLLIYYPNQPGAIKNSILGAGYDHQDIPSLLNRTTGRNSKTEFIYKALKIKS